MSFTAVINGQGNFTASVNGSAAFNVSVPDSPTLNVGMAAMGPTGLLSADAPLIYDSTLKNLSIAPDYYALKVHTHQISDVIGLQQALDGLQPSGDYATNAYVNATFQPIAGMSAYYLASNPAGYITNSALAPYITASTAAATYYPLTNPAGYITTSALSGYATESWVTSQGYETSSHASSTYYPLTNPAGYITNASLGGYATESWVTSQGYITSAALSPYLLSSTAASTYQLIGDYATNTDLTNGLATKANVTHTHDASAIVSGVIDLARIPIIPSQVQVVSTQNSIANLTVSEQAQITGAGVLVTTTDGNRWVYSGSGSKTSESSYVKVADITPDWTEISNKPAFGTMSLEATTAWLSKAGNLSGLANTATARTNLGLGTMAVETATNYLTKAGNLSGLANLATSRTNLGLGTMAVETATNYLAKSGNLSGLTDLATARSNLGLGTMATQSASSYYLASNPAGYITSASLSGYATESWVQSQGYLTAPYNPFDQSLNTTDNVQFHDLRAVDGLYEFKVDALGNYASWSYDGVRNSWFGFEGVGWDTYPTRYSATGITFPDNTVQTTAYTGGGAIPAPTDQNQNWIVAWHQGDYYPTEATQAGVLLNDGYHKADFGKPSAYPRIRVESGTSGTELMSSGIKFPDGTEQYTANTNLPSPADQTKPWLLSWDTTNLVWSETGGKNGLLFYDGNTHGIDFGLSGVHNPAIRVTDSSFTSWMELNPIGLKFPDGTEQTTAATNPDLSIYLEKTEAASTYYPLTNPSNYITDSALAPYLLSSTAASTYFPIPYGTPVDGQIIAWDGTNSRSTWIDNSARTLFSTVRNASGVLMPKGSVVYISGGIGNHPTVTLAKADSDATSARTYGVLAQDLANNADGTCVVIGSLTGVNTGAYVEGTQLYLSPTTAGAWTSTKPVAPQHIVYVAKVTRQSATVGSIEVQIQNGYELDELHDVLISSKTNKDLLVYESATSLWKNKSFATLGLTSIDPTLVSYINGALAYSSAPSQTNPFATQQFVDSAVAAYAAYANPLLPTSSQKDALVAASSPSASNAFITNSAMTSYVASAVPSASTSTAGKVQLATRANGITGTSTTLATTVDVARWMMLSGGYFNLVVGNVLTGTSGTGATSNRQGTSGWSIAAPTSAVGYAIAASNCVLARLGGTYVSRFDFSKPFAFSARVVRNAGTDSSSIFRMSIGKYAPVYAGDLVAASNGVMLKVAGTGVMQILCANGTTLTTVNTSYTPTTNSSFDVTMTSDGAGNVEVFVNGSSVGTSTGGPTTSVLSDLYTMCQWECENIGVLTGTRSNYMVGSSYLYTAG